MSIHICFIITRGDSIGGAQIHVRDMAYALQEDGYRVTVLTGTAGDMTDQLDAQGVNWELVPRLVREIKPLKDFLAVVSVFSRLKKLKPDLVSTHTAKAGMVGRAAAFFAGVPSIFTAHGWQFADGIPGKQAGAVLAIEKLVSPLCRKIITVSRYDFDLAVRKKAVKAEKMITIHNGLPWKPFLRSKDQDPGGTGQSGACRLLMVARFQKQKDHATLFKALSGLKDENWHLELVGDGPEMETAVKMADELGLLSRIDFAGQQLDVPVRMDRSDIYLLISNWEGFPRSIIEAMRAGLPVISSDVGGCRESVADGKTGYLVPKGDSETLKTRLSELINSRDLRLGMGEAGRARYEAEFTFRKMYEKTVDVYRSIVKQE